MSNNKKKILLIEDEEIMIGLLVKKLEDQGYEVEVAIDGEQGMSKIKQFKPDLILLDIVLPKMGGFEIMEKMVEDSELAKIPVIIISNSGQPVDLERAKKLGAKDWLVKTEFDPREVVEKVKKQIG
ncbi:MAG: response regulator [Candidatus Pacebacteria bacterium]|nr:response regulator [Candidatus Paceibacterota bacterium]